MVNRQIRVLIVDDHPGWRDVVKNLLLAAKDMVVVGEGKSGGEAIEQVAVKKPDILLLDMELPDQRGDVVMRHIHAVQPDMKVLALSSHNDRNYILNMLQHGAAGYLTKEEAPTMLIETIRNIISRGRSWISTRGVKNGNLTSLEQQVLTRREVQILKQLKSDDSVEGIAETLGISKKQVEKHLTLLMKKFEAESIDALKEIARRIY